MDSKYFENLMRWFGGYIQQFFSLTGDDFLNNNLHLKESHTHRVCGETQLLVEALKLNESDTRIAETIALLHDIGRFEQFKRYRTYNDTTSEDHAAMALRILRQERVLEPLDKKERVWIERAIEYHNKKSLPEGLDEKTAMFSKIIRDADKVDIYYLVIENLRRYYANPCTFQLEMEFPDVPYCSPEILSAIERGGLIDYRMLRTMKDAILLQVGWVYDIYYDATMRRVAEKRYLEQFIGWLPDTDEVKRATTAVMKYVRKRLANEIPELK